MIERFLYGDLPTTLRGQKILSLIGNEAVSLSKDISENIFFRKDEFATELPIRVSCCTWNVNGGTRSPNLNIDLGEDKFADWLLGKADRRRAAYDFTGEAEDKTGALTSEDVEDFDETEDAQVIVKVTAVEVIIDKGSGI